MPTSAKYRTRSEKRSAPEDITENEPSKKSANILEFCKGESTRVDSFEEFQIVVLTGGNVEGGGEVGAEGGGEHGGAGDGTSMSASGGGLKNSHNSGDEYIDPPLMMVEYACQKRCTYIANLTLDDYKPIAAVSRQRQCKNDLKGSHKRVVEWAMKHAESDLSIGVTFKYRHGVGKDFGRMASNSMMGVPRDIRGFVCVSQDSQKPILTDLDLDNCHPTILQWLCKRHGITCDALSEYVANRQKHKEELMESTGKSKDDVKSMFLAAVNSQSEMECWQKNLTRFFIELDKECKEIQQAFLRLTEYRHLLPHAEKAANEKLEEKKAQRRRDRKTTNGLTANVAGSFINLILCTWENRFLGVACSTIASMGLEVSVKNYDGMMIRGNHYPEGNEPCTVQMHL